MLYALPSVLWGSAGAQAAPSSNNNSAVIYSADKNKSQSTHPFDRPNLLNIYYPAESMGSLLVYIPAPYVMGDERDEVARNQRAESEIQKNVSIWLRIYTKVDRRTAGLKLIFPFHTFL